MRVVTIPGTGESFDLDRPAEVIAWNRALNRRYAMENLVEHPNALVRRIERRRRARIARMVGSFDRAVDVGAEDGSLAAGWRGQGRFTLLLDLDPAMLRRSGQSAVAADSSALPLAAASFDVVVLSAILEHVVSPVRTVAEAARVVRPGGRLVVYVPWDAAVLRLKRWARRLRFGLGPLHDGLAPGHLRIFDRKTLRALLSPVARRLTIRLDPWSLGFYAEAHL